MAWPKGKKKPTKTGGRKKGTPNKRTVELLEILEEEDFCPAQALIRIHRMALKQYEVFDQVIDQIKAAMEGEDQATIIRSLELAGRLGYNAPTYLSISEQAARDVMNYAFPRRKAIEFKPPSEGGQVIFFIPSNGREAKRKAG